MVFAERFADYWLTDARSIASHDPERYIVFPMIRLVSKYVLQPAGLFLIMLFGASLLWCGDAECWSGSSDDQCSSLLCSLFANHAGSDNAQNGSGTDCSCDCHMPTIMQQGSDIGYYPPVVNTPGNSVLSFLSAPPRTIYHPPLTA